MQTVYYPSQHFEKTVDALVSEHESFSIIVPGDNKKRDIIFGMLEAVVHQRRGQRISPIVGLFRKFQIRDFYYAIAMPASEHIQGGNYRIEYENNRDLVIYVIAR
jgi:hypothetical protein